MRFSAAELDFLDKVTTHYPQIKDILTVRLEEEQTNLLSAGEATIQVHQGRCQMLREILEQLNTATRPAKRTVTQPYSQ